MTDTETGVGQNIITGAIACLLIGGSLLVTVIIYWGNPVETDPVLSIMWPWAMGAATAQWGLPLAKKAVGERDD